jgi:hypothetical protein
MNLTKIKYLIESIARDLIKESKLADYGTNNTPAALAKEQEIGSKNVDPKAALTDLDINTLNRNHTIKEYRYGPLNPEDKKGTAQFWKDKAEMWDTTVEHAKTSRCKNCVAFNQKPEVLKKMADGIGKEGKKIVKEANLGFCEFFWFKCAGDRTCDAWVAGGPLKS